MRLPLRAALVFGLVAFLVYLTAANFVPAERRAESWWLPDEGVRLGLDLRGGIHMVISPDLVVALSQEVNQLSRNLTSELERKDIPTSRLAVVGERIEVAPRNVADAPRLREVVDDFQVLRVTNLGEGLLGLDLTDDWRD